MISYRIVSKFLPRQLRYIIRIATLSYPKSQAQTAASPKIEKLVTEIFELNPIEITELLEKSHNLPVFTMKLMKFDEKQKVTLIKEMKGLMEGMNLEQAKRFVGGDPAVVKADMSKDATDKLKEAFQKVGGVAEVEDRFEDTK